MALSACDRSAVVAVVAVVSTVVVVPVPGPQKFDTLLVKSRFPRPGLLMNSRTYLSF